jgi:metal-responsive CopG/Arc/MetJ family transcriptional regulator
VEATQKISVSLPSWLVAQADEIARREKRSRSRVISDALEELITEREYQQLAEGYSRMAEFNSALAEADMEAVNEIWAKTD